MYFGAWEEEWKHNLDQDETSKQMQCR